MKNRTHQRGQALVWFGVTLTAVISLTALAIDVGRGYFVARETQAVADASALAGAQGLYSGTLTRPVPTTYNDAMTIAGKNRTDGHAAVLQSSDIDVGEWKNGAFTVTTILDPAANAVRTRPHTTYTNLMAVFNNPQTTTNRNATAVFCALGGARPAIPIAIASGCLDCTPQTCASLPLEAQFGASKINNVAWYYPPGANGASGIDAYVPSCPGGGGGGGQQEPYYSDGDVLNLDNGVKTSVCSKFTCLVGQSFTVPVVQSNCNIPLQGSDPIVGFATVTIQAVNCIASPKFMTFAVKFNGYAGGTVNCNLCPTCGTGHVALVQ